MGDLEHQPSNFIRQIVSQDLANQKHQQVVTRFPPEPNGYLHIGHAKSICLNFGIAKDYQGHCHLRFDDTNPEKEDISFVQSIQEDVQWLGFQWHEHIRYSSHYFDQLYHFAIELIQAGNAYVCFLDAEQVREYRGTLTEPGKASPYRETSVADNLLAFEKMRSGQYKEGECMLRAKIDMSSSFMCMRDPVLYRIKFMTHHQTQDTWCIYPMYDFTHCISDALEGITHSLCTLEFQDNRRLYDWILDHINIPAHPQQIEFSRLNLEYTLMSKRKLQQLVTEGLVSAWDDPRMPTIAGLRRRGFTPESIREFCTRIGVTKQENLIEYAMLEACIRDDLNDNAPRAMAVLDPVKIVIENYPSTTDIEYLAAPNHPNKPEMGERKIPFTKTLVIEREDFKEEANKKYKRLVLGKEVRLRNAYVIKAERIEKNEQGQITTIFCQYDPETLGKAPADGRKVKGVIHWVSATQHHQATVHLYDRLFTVANPIATDNIHDVINPESLVVVENAYLEHSLTQATDHQAYQFERVGYFCYDPKSSTEQQPIFNRTITLKDTWAKLEQR